MSCNNTKSVDGQSAEIRWDITVGTGKTKPCGNNCRDCPNKEPTTTVNKMSKVEK